MKNQGFCDRCNDLCIADFTTLSCGHIFHARCACDFLFAGLPCIICSNSLRPTPAVSLVNTVYVRAPRELIIEGNMQEPEYIPAPDSWKIENYRGIPYNPENIMAILNEGGNLKDIGKRIRKLSVDHLVGNGITCDYLLSKSITMDEVFDSLSVPMIPSDLVVLGMSGDHMVLPFVSINFFHAKLKATASTMIAFICELRIMHLEQLKFTPETLKSLGFSLDMLISLGLTITRASYIFPDFKSMLAMGFRKSHAADPRFNTPIDLSRSWPTDRNTMLDWYKTQGLSLNLFPNNKPVTPTPSPLDQIDELTYLLKKNAKINEYSLTDKFIESYVIKKK